MNYLHTFKRLTFLTFVALILQGCVSTGQNVEVGKAPDARDREAILAMAGNYKVTFDFTETVAFQSGYKLKEPKVSGANEMVSVIVDQPGFISLQHLLVVGKDKKHVVKHWRQDWIYEPEFITEFVGFNQWRKRELSDAERVGKWAQVVYQVDDSIRYAGLAAWDHELGNAEWASAPSYRPLPRRDMTTREDYQAILASNRHAITPDGWVHEQDNSKVIIDKGVPTLLVREVGVNTYLKDAEFDFSAAQNYWQKTATYWEAVRTMWLDLERDYGQFGFGFQGETAPVYVPLMTLAGQVAEGDVALQDAIKQAKETIEQHVVFESSIETVMLHSAQ